MNAGNKICKVARSGFADRFNNLNSDTIINGEIKRDVESLRSLQGQRHYYEAFKTEWPLAVAPQPEVNRLRAWNLIL